MQLQRLFEWFGVTPRTQERAKFLAEASNILTASLDWETTLRSVANLVVPRLADWCAVDIVEEGVIRRVAVKHSDPAKMELGRKIARRYPADPQGPHPLMRVLRGGRSELYPEIPDGLLVSVAQDEEHLRIVRQLGLKSALVVPLIARGRPFGALSFVSAESGRRYGPQDLKLAEELAQRAALAVDNARLYREAQHAHQRFRELVDGLDAIIWEADPTTLSFTFISKQTMALLGYPPDRWVGRRDFWASLLHPDDREQVVPRAEECAVAGRDHDLEYRAIAADGRVLWLRDIVRVVRDPKGTIRQLRGVIVDITESKRVEAVARGAEALRQVARLANAAAHEINNPLAVINGSIELVLSSAEIDEASRATLSAAQNGVERIRQIVMNMQNITRLELVDWGPRAPEMLDLRKAGGPPPPPPEPPAPSKGASK